MFSFSELNWFFNDNIRYGNGDKINGSNTILDQIPFTLNRIKYNDLDEISISQSNNIYDSGGVIKVILRSEILLYFNNPKTTMDILKEVFKFRTLFTIFADAYVDFPKVLKFATANSGVLMKRMEKLLVFRTILYGLTTTDIKIPTLLKSHLGFIMI